MRILSIETSCDETAISIVDASGGLLHPKFIARANITLSQANLHAQYGGVFPSLAKREHAKSLVPILTQALTETKLLKKRTRPEITLALQKKLVELFKHEPELAAQFFEFIPLIKKPAIDVIAVTYGPGLEPALWVGVNFARALAIVWGIPLVPVNHMEGHIFGSLADRTKAGHYGIAPVTFPALALLVSGGHTELVLVKKLRSYRLLGKTRDDAVGEAFDKVARMLGLPYPGGPAISKLAAEAAAQGVTSFPLPRPMIKSDDLDFSFAGLKTAVLYAIKKLDHEPTTTEKLALARGFQDAVVDVITSKVAHAAQTHKVRTIVAGGGVAGNTQIREALTRFAAGHAITLRTPLPELSTDNALMIALASYSLAASKKFKNPKTLKAAGNLTLGR